jgi:hypothetical protein
MASRIRHINDKGPSEDEPIVRFMAEPERVSVTPSPRSTWAPNGVANTECDHHTQYPDAVITARPDRRADLLLT